MRVLLDTQALLWWLNDDPRLGRKARELIADTSNSVLVSVVSFWELSIKTRIGKLDDPGSQVMREVQDSRFEIVPIEPRHLEMVEALESLPGHRDPFDHLILAQSAERDAILITADRLMARYDVRCLRTG